MPSADKAERAVLFLPLNYWGLSREGLLVDRSVMTLSPVRQLLLFLGMARITFWSC